MFFPFSNFRNKEGHREPVFLERRCHKESCHPPPDGKIDP